MDQMKRYAVYYAPEADDFAGAAAAWLGWDAAQGCTVAHPDVPVPLAAWTAAPRCYGFHATLKPPIRLGVGRNTADLTAQWPMWPRICRLLHGMGWTLPASAAFWR